MRDAGPNVAIWIWQELDAGARHIAFACVGVVQDYAMLVCSPSAWSVA